MPSVMLSCFNFQKEEVLDRHGLQVTPVGLCPLSCLGTRVTFFCSKSIGGSPGHTPLMWHQFIRIYNTILSVQYRIVVTIYLIFSDKKLETKKGNITWF